MSAPKTPNRPTSQLRDDRFRLLEDLAKELTEEIVFPISFAVSLRISQVMSSDRSSMDQIVAEVQKDPLVASKLVQICNSALYSTSGQAVSELSHALGRVGLTTVRSVAMSCAMAQLAKAKESAVFAEQLTSLHVHSVKTAVIARLLAREFTRINPETAMLAGLVHDMGAFYIYSRVIHYPELVERPDTVAYLVAQWHESIGSVLLDALGLPQEVIDAATEVDVPRRALSTPRTLNDIVYLANLFAGGFDEMERLDLPDLMRPEDLDNPRFTVLQEKMDTLCAEALASW